MSSPVSTSSCSSDVDAAETFASALMGQIDAESVKNMVTVQRDMLSRFEKTNEMLINFNILSANRFAITSAQFRRNTQLMYDMKKDLDSIFKRIRIVKQKLSTSYPGAFKVSDTALPIVEDEEEEEAAETTDKQADTSTDKHAVKHGITPTDKPSDKGKAPHKHVDKRDNKLNDKPRGTSDKTEDKHSNEVSTAAGDKKDTNSKAAKSSDKPIDRKTSNPIDNTATAAVDSISGQSSQKQLEKQDTDESVFADSAVGDNS